MTETEPTLREFLEWLYKREPKALLSSFQIGLANAAIKYRNKVFSGGLRSGRTVTLKLVKEYYKELKPYIHSTVYGQEKEK